MGELFHLTQLVPSQLKRWLQALSGRSTHLKEQKRLPSTYFLSRKQYLLRRGRCSCHPYSNTTFSSSSHRGARTVENFLVSRESPSRHSLLVFVIPPSH
jgi:hypothetical protein